MEALQSFFIQLGFKLDESSLADISTKLNNIADKAKEIAVKVKPQIDMSGSNIGEKINKSINLDGVTEKVKSFANSAADYINSMSKKFSLSNISQSISTAFAAAKDRALEIAGSIGDKVKNAYHNLGTSIQSVFKSSTESIGNFFRNIGTSIGPALSTAGTSIRNFFTGIPKVVGPIASSVTSTFSKAFTKLPSIAASVWPKITSGFTKVAGAIPKGLSTIASGFTKLGSVGAKAIKTIIAPLSDLSDKLSEFSQKFRYHVGNLAKTAAGILLGSAGVGAIVNSVAGELDDLSDSAARAGISAKNLAEIERVSNLTDSSVQSVRMTIESLNKAIGQAANGVGRGAQAFKKFGIAAKDSNGQLKTADQLYTELAIRSTKMSNAQFTAMAQTLGIDAMSIQSLRSQGEAISSLGKALNKLGISLKDETGNIKSLSQMAADLSKLNKEQYDQVMDSIGDGSKNLVRIVADYQKAREGLQFDEDRAADLGSTFKDELGSVTEILGMLKRAIVSDILEPWSKALANLRKRIADNAKVIRRVVELLFKGLVRAFESVGSVIGKLFSYIDRLVSYFDSLSPAEQTVFKIVAAAVALTAVIALCYDKLLLIPQAIGFILTAGAPLIAMFATIAAVITGILLLYGDYLNYVEEGESAFNWGAFDGILDGFSTALTTVIEKVKEFWALFTDYTDKLHVFDTLKEAVQGIIDSISSIIKGTGNLLSGIFGDPDKALQGLKDIESGVATFFGTTIPNLIKTAGNTILAAVGAIFKWDEPDLKNISDAFNGFIDDITSGVSLAYSKVKEFVALFSTNLGNIGFIEDIKRAFSTLLSSIPNWIGGIKDLILGIFTLDTSRIDDGFTKLGEAVRKNIDAIIDNVQASGKLLASALGALFGWDDSKVEDIGNRINAAGAKIKETLDSIIQSVSSFAKEFVKNLDITGFLPDIGAAITSLGGAITPAVESVTSLVSGIWNWNPDEVQSAFDQLKPALEAGVDSIRSILESVGDLSISIAAEFLGWDDAKVASVKADLTDMLDNISGGVKVALDSLSDILGEITSKFMVLLESLTPLIDPIERVVRQLVTGIAELGGPVLEVLGQLAGLFSDLFGILTDGSEGLSILDTLVEILGGLITLVGDGLSGAINIVGEFLRIVASFIKGIRDLVTGEKSLGEVWNDISDSVIGSITRLANKFSEWWNDTESIAGKIANIFVWLKDSIVGAWDAIVDKVMSAVNYVMDSITTLMNYGKYAAYRIANPVNGVSYDEWLAREAATPEQLERLESLNSIIKEQETHRDSAGNWGILADDTSAQFDQAKLDEAIRDREALIAALKNQANSPTVSVEPPAVDTVVESPAVNVAPPAVNVPPSETVPVVAESPDVVVNVEASEPPTVNVESPAVNVSPRVENETQQPDKVNLDVTVPTTGKSDSGATTRESVVQPIPREQPIIVDQNVPDVVIPELSQPDVSITSPDVEVPSQKVEVAPPKVESPKIDAPVVNVESPDVAVNVENPSIKPQNETQLPDRGNLDVAPAIPRASDSDATTRTDSVIPTAERPTPDKPVVVENVHTESSTTTKIEQQQPVIVDQKAPDVVVPQQPVIVPQQPVTAHETPAKLADSNIPVFDREQKPAQIPQQSSPVVEKPVIVEPPQVTPTKTPVTVVETPAKQTPPVTVVETPVTHAETPSLPTSELGELIDRLQTIIDSQSSAIDGFKEYVDKLSESIIAYSQTSELLGSTQQEFSSTSEGLSDTAQSFKQDVETQSATEREFGSNVETMKSNMGIFDSAVDKFAANIIKLAETTVHVSVSGLPSEEALRNFTAAVQYSRQRSAPTPPQISNQTTRNNTTNSSEVRFEQHNVFNGVPNAQSAVSSIEAVGRRTSGNIANAVTATSQKPAGAS